MESIATPAANEGICAGCLKRSNKLINSVGDPLCPNCRAFLWAAAVLLDDSISDEPDKAALREDAVIPTLVFAKVAGGSQGWEELTQADGATQYRGLAFLEMMHAADGWRLKDNLHREYAGWELVGELNGVPLARVEPLVLVPEHHPGTRVLKEVRIQVLSRWIKPEAVQARYRRMLTEEGAQWSANSHGRLTYDFSRGFLDLAVSAGCDLSPLEVDGLGGNPFRHPAYHFPPPDFVAGVYKTLFGSNDERTRRGYAYALDLYGKPKDKSPRSIIPAFVAWHIGEGPKCRVPPTERPRVSRILNRHLLGPCGLQLLPEDRWSPNDSVWRDVEDLWERFVRLYAGGLASPLTRD